MQEITEPDASRDPIGPPEPPAPRRLTLADLSNRRLIAAFRSVALSPDGACVAYASRRAGDVWQGRDTPPLGVDEMWDACRLTALDIASDQAQVLAPESCAAWNPLWSPDGRHLAFLVAERPEGPVTLWAWSPGAAAARRVVDAPVQALFGAPRWFPDSRRICVPLVPPGGGVPETAAAPGIAVFQSPPPAGDGGARGPWVWADLAAVDVESPDVVPLVTGRPAKEGFPAPAGGHLLWAEAATLPDPTRYVCHIGLHLRRADGWTGRVATLVTGVSWEPCLPRWSPDGSRFAAIVGDEVTVWTVASPEAPAGRLALPEGHRPNGWLAWTADGHALIVWAGRELWQVTVATEGISAQPLDAGPGGVGGTVRRQDRDALPDGPLGVLAQAELRHVAPGVPPVRVAGGFEGARGFGWRFWQIGDATPDGRSLVYAVGDPKRSADLWVATDRGRRRRRLTALNAHLEGIAEGTWHTIPFRTIDGAEVGAALLLPPGWPAGRPCPTVVGVYPGHRPSRNREETPMPMPPELLAACGWAVLLPDIPYRPDDVADPIEATPAAALPAVDEAIRLGHSDPARLAVIGASHGGTAVLGLLTRTGRFRAAVADAGTADMASRFGQMHLALEHPEIIIGSVASTETGQRGMGGPPWERPLRYVMNSPIFLLDRITTPLLLVTGTRDGVSWAQSGEVFVGLRRLERPCTLLVGRGEGHSLMDWSEANRTEAVRRILAWLRQHLETE